MKQSCPFILALILVISFQYARCESYKEWYEKTVKHCIPGTTFKSYTPNIVCTCKLPGVVENCQFVGMVRDARGTLMQLSKGKGSSNCPKGRRFKHEDGCNWCTCTPGGVTKCTVKLCPKGSSNCPKGRRFKHEDGCNWCTCTPGGVTKCTLIQCSEDKSFGIVKSSSNCPKGRRFKHEDGCNWCTCTPGGVTKCTLKRCSEDKSFEIVKSSSNCPKGLSFQHEDGCNWCTCTPGGLTSCTLKRCPEDKSFEIVTSSITCLRKGLYTFFDGCNWCKCEAKGTQALCTNLPCIRVRQKKEKVLNGLVSTAVINYKARGPSNCTEARYKHPDGCNWCTCSNGWDICTVMKCIIKKPLSTRFEYDCKTKPQAKWAHPDNCNWCYCMDENTLLCTTNICDNRNKLNKPKNPKKRLQVINECEGKPPGRFLSDDGCNWCYCIGTGSIMCTIMLCPVNQISLEKKLSSSFCEKRKAKSFSPDSCNTCYCDDQGTAMCTLKPCSKRLQNDMKSELMKDKLPLKPSSGTKSADKYVMLKEETKEKPLDKKMLQSLKEKAQHCKAGEKFKEPRGCNWCTCIEDGVIVCDSEPC